MLDVALLYIRDVLDQHLAIRLGVDSGCVVLHGLVGADSHQIDASRNKIVITLVGLEHESNKQFYGGFRREGSEAVSVNPAIYFNLDILISANFDDYSESLKQLTMVIEFFQAHVALDRVSHPSLPEGLTALKFEIENSPSEKMHNLWTALGVNYLPSIVYKVRHVAVQDGQVKGRATTVQGVSGAVLP